MSVQASGLHDSNNIAMTIHASSFKLAAHVCVAVSVSPSTGQFWHLYVHPVQPCFTASRTVQLAHACMGSLLLSGKCIFSAQAVLAPARWLWHALGPELYMRTYRYLAEQLGGIDAIAASYAPMVTVTSFLLLTSLTGAVWHGKVPTIRTR